MGKEDIRILILDDDANFRVILKTLLQGAGYARIFDTDHQEHALKEIYAGNVDIVLLDWWMPIKSGIDVLRAIRAHDVELPVIMLTNARDEEHVKEALTEGCSDYVLKPYKGQELLEKIEAAFFKYSSKILPSLKAVQKENPNN